MKKSKIALSQRLRVNLIYRFSRLPRAAKALCRGKFGLWRSLVARPSGGRKVAGSSPASPTIFKTVRTDLVAGGLAYWEIRI